MLWGWKTIGHLRHSFSYLMCSTRGGKDPSGRERTLILTVFFEQNHSASFTNSTPTAGTPTVMENLSVAPHPTECPKIRHSSAKNYSVYQISLKSHNLSRAILWRGCLPPLKETQFRRMLVLKGKMSLMADFLTQCNLADIQYFYFLLLTSYSGTGGDLQRLNNILLTN